ncbi:hypothetical protein V6N12_058622 [Hibiscus sabdariffa]|uniref:Uncharacterized protein n=1 Tax=Hibiscus sabdariffa TaxID=183260 RepID=A0ABR2ESN6_9ROSI
MCLSTLDLKCLLSFEVSNESMLHVSVNSGEAGGSEHKCSHSHTLGEPSQGTSLDLTTILTTDVMVNVPATLLTDTGSLLSTTIVVVSNGDPAVTGIIASTTSCTMEPIIFPSINYISDFATVSSISSALGLAK